MHAASLREARRQVPSSSAEDVAHEALVRAWRQRSTCRDADPMPWLRTIVRREALRHLTRSREHEELTPTSALDHGAAHELESLPERLDVRSAVRALGPDDRRLLWLRYAADFTQPAVADAMGWPEGTVKVRLHRARRQVAGALRP
jgi:RNA polymerase sigma-70 factor (ECF subfamily)